MTTREELVQLAARLIGRDGLQRASMRGLAREAGVSLATVQHHFRTKEDLWKAVMDESAIPNEALLSEAPYRGASLVRTIVHHRLGLATTSPGLAGRVMTDGSPEGETLLAYLVERTESLRALHRERMEEAFERGSLRRVDVDGMMALMAVALPALSSCTSAVRQIVGPDLHDDEARARVADAIVDILLHGLLPRSSEEPPEQTAD